MRHGTFSTFQEIGVGTQLVCDTCVKQQVETESRHIVARGYSEQATFAMLITPNYLHTARENGTEVAVRDQTAAAIRSLQDPC